MAVPSRYSVSDGEPNLPQDPRTWPKQTVTCIDMPDLPETRDEFRNHMASFQDADARLDDALRTLDKDIWDAVRALHGGGNYESNQALVFSVIMNVRMYEKIWKDAQYLQEVYTKYRSKVRTSISHILYHPVSQEFRKHEAERTLRCSSLPARPYEWAMTKLKAALQGHAPRHDMAALFDVPTITTTEKDELHAPRPISEATNRKIQEFLDSINLDDLAVPALNGTDGYPSSSSEPGNNPQPPPGSPVAGLMAQSSLFGHDILGNDINHDAKIPPSNDPRPDDEKADISSTFDDEMTAYHEKLQADLESGRLQLRGDCPKDAVKTMDHKMVNDQDTQVDQGVLVEDSSTTYPGDTLQAQEPELLDSTPRILTQASHWSIPQLKASKYSLIAATETESAPTANSATPARPDDAPRDAENLENTASPVSLPTFRPRGFSGGLFDPVRNVQPPRPPRIPGYIRRLERGKAEKKKAEREKADQDKANQDLTNRDKADDDESAANHQSSQPTEALTRLVHQEVATMMPAVPAGMIPMWRLFAVFGLLLVAAVARVSSAVRRAPKRRREADQGEDGDEEGVRPKRRRLE